MPNTKFCGPHDDMNLVDCRLSNSFKCCQSGEKVCRFAYASWCPVCDLDQRKRSKSESTEVNHRKRGRDNIKIQSPKKIDKHYAENNFIDARDMKLDSSRVRTNLCELPTSYITGNCQINVPCKEKTQISNGMTNFCCQKQLSSEIGSDFDSFLKNAKYLQVKSPDFKDRVHRHLSENLTLKKNGFVDPLNSPTKINSKDTKKNIPSQNVIKKTDSTVRPLTAKIKPKKKTTEKSLFTIKNEDFNSSLPEMTPDPICEVISNNIIPNSLPLDQNLELGDVKRQRVRHRSDSDNLNELNMDAVKELQIIKKKAREVSPLENKSVSKTSIKYSTVKNRHKLSTVKLRKVRSKIAHSVSSDSNLSESDASETEEEDNSEENIEFKSVIPNEKDIKLGSTPVAKTITAVTVEHPTLGKWPVRNSLFAHVPAYIMFASHDDDPVVLPPGVGRYLKWRLSTITPVLVRKTLQNTGFRLVKSESVPESNEWVGCWGKHMKSVCFQTLKDNQKLNHFPGTFQIGRKDRLWKNLQRLMFKFGHREFGFIPRTYVLPQDLKQLRNAWEKTGQERWIIKPPASARGTGIKVIHRWAHLPKKKSLVVQQYISDPYLINGSKFDLRLYVLVVSFDPLRIYLYPNGLARFASTQYSDDINSLNDRFMHLTNYSINKLSSKYTSNEDANSCKGHKWTITKLWEYLEQRGVDTKAIWRNLQSLVIKTMISGESSITQLTNVNIGSRYNCYELFGIDVLLDERLKPWLLEVNISPSLHSASPLDLHVKGPLVQTLLNLAQFHLPTKLNKAKKAPLCLNTDLYTTRLTYKESSKHIHYMQFQKRNEYLESILKELTGDDVRHLIQAEDELTVIGNFERIFPTKHTHSYFEFMEPRYYNRLFDAWENRYEHNRQAGIRRLQVLCEQKVHLVIAPVPVTKETEKNGEMDKRPSVELNVIDGALDSLLCPLEKPTICADSFNTDAA